MNKFKNIAKLGVAITALSFSMSANVKAETAYEDLITASIGGSSQATVKKAVGLSNYMNIYGETSAPLGFMSFCSRYPSDCTGGTTKPSIIELDAGSWGALNEVNDLVNAAVAPVSDQELYNQVEVWAYPDNKGDCEDYVLAKQKQLIEMGWPQESLLITVAIDEFGGGHAVLTVKTSIGDLILDNQRAEILPWQQTTYTYVKRQSTSHPALWVALSS
ncbi:MAG: transglutaminase-like cysteine peptidase [Hyphomicrobiales bacterium]